MDVREQSTQDDLEEVIRVALGSNGRQVFSNLRVIVAQDSSDGHTVSLQPVTKMNVRDQTGAVMSMALPLLLDVPISFKGGGGVSTTHPVKQGDEGTVSLSAAPIDTWHQQGGVQAQIDGRQHSLSDATYHPGGRSDPRMLQQVSTSTHQVRTDDKKSVIDHGPDGTHHKTVDPSTQAASANFDPFTQAETFFEHILHPTNGHAVNATDGGTTHSTTLTHATGFLASAANGAHTVAAHPQNGIGIASSIAHTISAPNANLDSTGNLSNQGTHTAKGDITSSSGNITAPSGGLSGLFGSFGGFKFGGGGGKSGGSGNVAFGSVEATTGPLTGPYVAANTSYTVAQLNQVLVPSQALAGARAYVSDASSPSFLQPLQGGGSQGCPAVCVLGAPTNDGGVVTSEYQWVAG